MGDFAIKNNQLPELQRLYVEVGLSCTRLSQIYHVNEDTVRRTLRVLCGVTMRGRTEAQRLLHSLTIERLRMNCVITKAGCWIWQGKPSSRGYCTTWHMGERDYIHRVAYKLHTGAPIPPNRVVIQICENRLCCGPEHLEMCRRSDPLAVERLAMGQLRWRLSHQKESQPLIHH